MQKLYKFRWNSGRAGLFEGLFIREESDSILGGYIHISDRVCGRIREGDIIELSDDQDFIEKAKKYGVVPIGYNPFKLLK